MPTYPELESVFLAKYGKPAETGWSPRRRHNFRYFLPADIYEAVVARNVLPGSNWLDVGGGHAIFPDNPNLATELVARCNRVVAVDPSENVHRNPFVHERVQNRLEDYFSDNTFDIATLRMVVEHVDQPEAFTSALSRLVRPGGLVVVFTINRWAPVSIVSHLLPFQMHHPIKRIFWGGEAEDTFPVHYRMNTRKALRQVFEKAGFQEESFHHLDDLSTFGRFNWMGYLELSAWKGFHKLGLTYPENCLLAVYCRNVEANQQAI